jgi:large exoprotein involved in heme utilization and adhesion
LKRSNVSTQRLTVLDGGTLGTGSFSTGKGGDVQINATESIYVEGLEPTLFQPSILTAASVNEGSGGQILVNTRQLSIVDGGRVDASAFSSGDAGSVTINATDSIEVSGTVPGSRNPSLISSAANIVDESLRALYGALPVPTGKAGSVTLTTNTLKVREGALVTVKNDGFGSAGTLQVNANQIILTDRGGIVASTASGQGGNMSLNADLLLLRRGSNITSSTGGLGDGGNTNINAPIIIGLENSDIIANAVEGRGGKIQITTQGIFGLKYREQLTSGNDITASSEFGVNGTVQVNTIGVDPNSGLTALPVDIVDPSQKIATGCTPNRQGSFVITGRGGVPTNPHQNLTIERPWLDLRASPVVVSPGVASPVVASARHALPMPPVAVVEAVDWRRNHLGQPELIGLGVPPDRPQITTCAR